MAFNQQSRAGPGINSATKVADDAFKRKEALKAWADRELSTPDQLSSRANQTQNQPQPQAQAQTQAQPQPKALHDAENSKTPGHNPDSAHFSKKYPCTYESCGRHFDEKKSLKRHKEMEHDYCKLCDMDFESDDALHLHKMQSEKHVVCNICGKEFQSEPGRDRHYKQSHAAQQNIECRGCHKVFAKGSGLLLHFEQNACKPLQSSVMIDRMIPAKEMLEQNRALLAMQMEELQKKEKEKKAALRNPTPYGNSMMSETEGGVKLQPSLLDKPDSPKMSTAGGNGAPNEFENLIELATSVKDNLQAPLIPESVYAKTEGGLSDTTNSTARAWLNKYPPLQPQVPGNGGDLNAGMNNLSLSGSSPVPSAPGAWGNASQKLFPDARPTPVPPGIDIDQLKGIKVGEDAAEAAMSGKPGTLLTVDPIDNKYHCPFPTCDHTAADTFNMIEHMQKHTGIQNRCSSCYRIFKSASALLAHMESPSTRCRIRNTKGYGNAIHIVSGGFLGAYGMMEDGTVKLESQKKPESFW